MSFPVPGVSVRPMYAFAEALQQDGISMDPLLARAGVARSVYDDPGSRIPYESARLFYLEASRLSPRPALGLAACRHFDATQLQLLEYYLASSPDVLEALRSLVTWGALLRDKPPFALEEIDGGVVLRFLAPSPAVPRCVVDFVVGTLHLVGRRVFGRVGKPVSCQTMCACFAYAPPDAVAEYTDFFDGAVVFDAPHSGLLVGAHVLHVKMARANQWLRQVLETHLEGFGHPTDPLSFSHRVRSLIADALSDNGVDMDSIATKLHMSRSTLRRKLAGDGTTLRALTHDVRVALALEHLRRPETSISEIAFLVGYNDVTAFHKAFKRWTGLTPSEQRARLLANQASVGGRADTSHRLS